MFSFNGKVSRSIYWTTTLLNLFIVSIVVLGNIVLYKGIEGVPMVSPDLFRIILLISLIPALPALWFVVAVTVKRFHDRNKSGWWALIALTGVGILWILIECGFMKSIGEASTSTVSSESTTPTPTTQITVPTRPKIQEEIHATVPQVVVPIPNAPQQVPQVTVTSIAKEEVQQEMKEEIKQEVQSEVKPEIKPEVQVEIKKDIQIESKETPFPPASVVSTHIETTVLESKVTETTPPVIPTSPLKPVESTIKPQTVSSVPKVDAPYTPPPARSMAEMLAELDRLSKSAPKATSQPVAQVKQVDTLVQTESVSVTSPQTSTPANESIHIEEQKPVAAHVTTIEDIPAPKTSDDLTSVLNTIMAEAEKTADVSEETVATTPLSTSL